MTISLNKFIQNSESDLEVIKNSFSSFNIFNVLKIQHREIRHSNFLGWLFDPNESHNLRSVFLKQLLTLIDKESLLSFDESDFNKTEVFRESKNDIDILIINKKIGFSICIENKIRQDFSNHQLEKYYDYVESNYQYLSTRIYLTLTPFNNENHLNFRRGNKYTNISYQNIVDFIKKNKVLINVSSDNVKSCINQYKEMIEKDLLHNNNEVKLAQKIYKKYHKEIEFVLKHKPTFSIYKNEISDSIKEGLFGDFEIIENQHHLEIIRLLPKNEKLKTVFKDERFKSWDGDYMFCLELFIQKDHIWLKWCFGNIVDKALGLQEKKKKMLESMVNFDCFKEYPNVNFHKADFNDDYAGICGVNIFYFNTYIKQDKNFLDYLIIKFKEIDDKLIKPWVIECIEKLG